MSRKKEKNLRIGDKNDLNASSQIRFAKQNVNLINRSYRFVDYFDLWLNSRAVSCK